MEKRKRKPKSPSNQHEFVSPFSLEECVARLPKENVEADYGGWYWFKLKSNLNDRRNQTLNVRGRLYALSDTETSVMIESSDNPISTIVMLVSIPWIGIILGGFLHSLVAGFALSIANALIFLASTENHKKRLITSLSALFLPIPKSKQESRSLLDHALPPHKNFYYESKIPIQVGLVRLQRLVFTPHQVTAYADDDGYQIQIDSGTKTNLSLYRVDEQTIAIEGRIGQSILRNVTNLLFACGIGLVLIVSDSRWASMVCLMMILSPFGFFIGGLIGCSAMLQCIREAVPPTPSINKRKS